MAINHDPFERELEAKIAKRREQSKLAAAEADALEEALKSYRKSKGIEERSKTPTKGWKQFAKEIVDESDTPLTSSDVVASMRLMGYDPNARTISSTLSVLAKNNEIASQNGLYSKRLSEPQTAQASSFSRSDLDEEIPF